MSAANALHIVCPHCSGVNRVPAAKLDAGGCCGACKQPLFTGHPIVLAQANFQKHVLRNDIPMLVDFWAEWCGPCKAMAPVFQQAAAALEPQVRLAKVDTELEEGIAGTNHIRSIPTLVLFKGGRETARIAGAMDLQNLLAWVRQHL